SDFIILPFACGFYVFACDQPTFVSGTEGQMFDFRCEYQNDMKNHSKYFCCITSDKSDHLVRTSKHNQWTKEGRVSLYDNMTADFFLIRVDNLYLNDSGMYWCGAGGDDSNVRMSKIYLNVSQAHINQIILVLFELITELYDLIKSSCRMHRLCQSIIELLITHGS
uniref:Ig-like domain-containing protein n=1 Tax=Cyprinodon variegatus TaxID=28743 RepID=A0A3Q2DY64_CYPVA